MGLHKRSPQQRQSELRTSSYSRVERVPLPTFTFGFAHKIKLFLVLIVILLSVAGHDAWAQFNFSSPMPLNSNASTDVDNDDQVHVATDGQGNWAAVWSSNQNIGGSGNDKDIIISRSTDNGSTWTAPAVLNTNAGSDSGNDVVPVIITDGLGHWVVVWSSNENVSGAGSDSDILVARSTDIGVSWSSPALLNNTAIGDIEDDQSPRLMYEGDGTLRAVWWVRDIGGSSTYADGDILMAYSYSHGQGWSNPQPLNNYATTDGSGDLDAIPEIATDGSNVLIAVWTSWRNVGSTIGTDPDIIYTRTTNGGLTWSAPQALNSNASSSAAAYDYGAQVATDGAGNWVVVWWSEDDLGGTIDEDEDLLVSRSSDNGATWSTASPLNTDAATDLPGAGDRDPFLSTDGKGTWIVVWNSRYREDTSTGSDLDIFAAISKDNGATWTAPEAINSATTDAGGDLYPKSATDSLGNWIIAWQSSDTLTGTVGPDSDIFTSRDLAPFVTSIEREDPNPTNSWGLYFRVTFSEGVSGVNSSDFAPVGIPGAYISTVSTVSSDIYRVRVANVTGTGTLELHVTDNDSIVDNLGNPLGGWGTSNGDYSDGEAYTIDIPPRVTGIYRDDPNPTTAPQVDFRVNFSENVTGVDSTDLAVQTTGITGASIVSVVPATGPASSYTVAVSTGTGNGTLKLNVIDNDSIRDGINHPLGSWGVGNGNYSSGQTYTIDNTPPSAGTVTSDAGPYTGDNTQLSFSWSGFNEPDSAIAYYEVALGNNSDPEVFEPYASVGLATTTTFSASGLPGGIFTDGEYICSVRAINTVNLPSPSSTANVIVDVSIPLTGSVTFSSDPAQSQTLLSFSWSGFSDPQSGLAFYEVAFGDETDPYAYQNFTSVGLSTSITFVPGNFPSHFPSGIFPDRQYKCTVRAVNNVDLRSVPASGSFVVDYSPPEPGTVVSDAGASTLNAKALSFSWSGFSEPHTAISYYEVALGTLADPVAYQPFTHVGLNTTVTLIPGDIPAHFPEGVFYDDAPDGVYLCSVRAVNTATLVSTAASASVTVQITRMQLGQEVTLPNSVDLASTTWEGTNVFQVGHAGKMFASSYERYFNINWVISGSPNYSQTYYTSSVPVKEPMVLYHTHSGAARTLAPQVDLSVVPRVVIHYNNAISPADLWKEGSLLSADNDSGLVVLQYDQINPTIPADFIGIEVVEVKPYTPDVPDGTVHIGSRPQPDRGVPDAIAPFVTRGGPGSTPEYIYQHTVADAQQEGEVWAIRKNPISFNMEIVWRRTGLADVEWPYELRRYTADWPVGTPLKYQLYVRGSDPALLGPTVDIPAVLQPELQVYEEFVIPSHHAYLNANTFSADGAGWALLKYQTGPQGKDWVGFEVIRAVLHNDTNFFDLTPASWDIGSEISDAYHEGPLPGHIHEGERYAPAIYDVAGGGTGQIFSVNLDLLEVWWYNLSRTEDPEGLAYPPWPAERVQWPSKVVRYDAVWPTAPDTIVIARQNGTGVIDPAVYGSNWEIYSQNDPSMLGFNPNDEHAIKRPYGTGNAIFALRDDLGTPTTSEPYVLLKYIEQTGTNLWRFKVYRVVAEQGAYVFGDWATLSNDPADPAYDPTHDPPSDPYEKIAGQLVQAPFPLGTFNPSYCQENTAVSGPVLEDRQGYHWAKAGGNDGGTADLTIQYFYPIESSFYFPTGTYQEGDHVPWLDQGSGTPTDVIYTVSWPTIVPTMKISQTLIEAMNGLPHIGGESGPCSVDILYQQSVENGGGSSVMLIDPIQSREVDLASIPADITVEDQGTEKVFPQLSLALRLRVTYDPLTLKLKFKGIHVDPTTGFDYAILNVMSVLERDELLALSQDAAWQTAVTQLYEASQDPVEIADSSVDPYDMLALTTGFAQGVGYVTLAMQNGDQCGALPISLEIFQVVAELDPGDTLVIKPACPFDETLTLRHKGDFGGRTEDYEFEWRYLPDADGTEPVTRPDPIDYPDPADYRQALETYWAQWTPFDAGAGKVDVTISGPGLLTLSDNWFVCRYKYIGAGLSWSDVWSEPVQAQLAEGWIKRVVGDINPFDQRASGGGIEGAEDSFFSYKDTDVNTVVSMISQAGEPWAGNIPLNCDGLDNFGLCQIYETVLNRGKMLSIDAAIPPYPPANTALLLIASRIADLYQLLGNEAYADAADPTIAFGTSDGQYGDEASSLHCFMNTTSSLLEEELALLRGRDDSVSPGVDIHPFYNRLIWNFTNDINGGEVAYALNYNIRDALGNVDGSITEADAKALYPQGHGDAWGHYLTAIKTYYALLRNPNYVWSPRSEGLLIGGTPTTVDYLDERKFAQAAAAKARTGSEIVNLTYRQAYVEDPSGQWQGYQDPDTDRAWGLAEWASRAGQGTYLDWVVGNAILPDEDTVNTGIQKIDRTTVLELRDVASRYEEVQAHLDMADLGLNPIGLATNVVPFDISPTEIDAGNTHFEQIYDRAVGAMNNAITVFDHANNSTQLLRRQADTLSAFQQTVTEREADLKNRLIEIFGYPYPDDIGPGRTYPSGYDGPDLYHYTYIDPSELAGVEYPPVMEIQGTVKGFDVLPDGSLEQTEKQVTFHMSTSADRFGLVKPETWVGERRALGEIQMARSDLIQARARFERALSEYNNLLARIEGQSRLLEAQYDLRASEIKILNLQFNEQEELNDKIYEARSKQLDFRADSRFAVTIANALAEALPLSAGFSTDFTSTIRSAIRFAGAIEGERFTHDADRESLAELDHQMAAQEMHAQTNIQLTTQRSGFAIEQQVEQLEQLIREELSLRLELYTMQEAMQQASGRYLAALARGLRLVEDRSRFRRQTAADVQERRYKDMAFRIFRNDALQKYRAQFDLAARYVYLAAKAYDFETTFLSSDFRAGENFLTDIIRERLIGTISPSGFPQTGIGLADPMARMSQNFQVLKGQLGFNNPQRETNRFSLRAELFRVQPGIAGNRVWRETLWQHVVPNLLELPDFLRYCRIFQPHWAVEPAIVIPFETNVNFGLNFFGWPAGGGDNAYDSTNFTTKVRSVGVWFSNYNNLGGGMINTPRVYLVPVGSDIQRSPTGFAGETREFRILDQKLPAPFSSISANELNDPSWIPYVNNLTDILAAVRKYSSFRAYHDSGDFNESEVIRDSRLIGRSVWNTRWLLIIPAGTLHTDRNEGLNRFIDGALFGGERDGNGVSDIKIFFETYAYSGN